MGQVSISRSAVRAAGAAAVLVLSTCVTAAIAAPDVDDTAARFPVDPAADYTRTLAVESCGQGSLARVANRCVNTGVSGSIGDTRSAGDLPGARSYEARLERDALAGESVWLPYYRLERVAPGQPVEAPGETRIARYYERQVLGVRHELDASLALRVEFARTAEQVFGGERKTSEIKAQAVLRF